MERNRGGQNYNMEDIWAPGWPYGRLVTYQEYLQRLCMSEKLTFAVSSYWDLGIHCSSWSLPHRYSLSLTWPLWVMLTPPSFMTESFFLGVLEPILHSFPMHQWVSITFKQLKSKILSMPSLKPLFSFSPFFLTIITLKLFHLYKHIMLSFTLSFYICCSFFLKYSSHFFFTANFCYHFRSDLLLPILGTLRSEITLCLPQS